MIGLGEVVDTCTGGGEGHLPGLIVGSPFAILAVIAVYVRPSVPLGPAEKTLFVFPLGLGLAFIIPLVVSVSMAGKVVCGLEFAVDRGLVSGFERWIPIINLAFHLVLAFGVLRRRPISSAA